MKEFVFEVQRFAMESVNNILDNIQITGTASLDKFDVILNDAASKIITLTEDNDDYENRLSEVTIQALGGNDSIYNSGAKVAIDGGTGNDSIKNGYHLSYSGLPTTDDVTISSGIGNDSIYNSGSNVSIDGGDGDDTIENGDYYDNPQNVTINGGASNDTFVYSSGDDTIGDYDVKDSISLSSSVKDFDLSGDDVIIGFDEGSLTISDAAGKAITFVEKVNGKVTTSVNVFAAEGIFNNKTTSATAVTLAADSSSFNAASYSKLVSIDGGILSDATEIVGNKNANKIYAGAAGSTINGGKGNDSLWGGDGSDMFIYESGGGKDVVYNFTNDDALQLNGSFTASVKNNSIAFKVDSQADAITLHDYTATSFNINGDMYQVSGNTLKK